MTRIPAPRPSGSALALSRVGVVVALGAALTCAAAPLGAQEPTRPVAPPLAAVDTTPPPPVRRGVSPRGAFLRAMAIPGWGHTAIGSYGRGAFYFVAEGVTAWGLIKTHERLVEAERRVAFREGFLREGLAIQGVTDPAEIQTALDDDEALQSLIGLRDARKNQKQDWTALGIFLVFLSGADAYVSAHLQHFPAPLTLEAQPSGGGRVDLSVGVKLPR